MSPATRAGRLLWGKNLAANADPNVGEWLLNDILAIEAETIAAYLASPDAERALAEALIAPLQKRLVDFHGPPPENERDVDAVAREALAAWRERL